MKLRRIKLATGLIGVIDSQGSQIAEFAISAPLLALFVVGIFDFSGAFNLKQKISSAAQAGVLVAANQSTRDLDQPATTATPPSVIAIETSIFNNLVNDNVLKNANVGNCKPANATIAHVANSLVWKYTLRGCSGIAGDRLVVTIDRGNVFASGSEQIAASRVTLSYPHHWLFNRVITLVVSSSVFSATTQITADYFSQNMS